MKFYLKIYQTPYTSLQIVENKKRRTDRLD